MPGVPGPGSELAMALEGQLSRALEELRAVAEAGRAAVTQAAEAAVSSVEPVTRAAEELRVETAALSRRLDALGRQVEVLSLRLGVPLAPDLEPELEPSELLLAAADPEALFQAAEDAGTPVAHPPAFSSRRPSSGGPAHSSSLVSLGGGGLLQPDSASAEATGVPPPLSLSFPFCAGGLVLAPRLRGEGLKPNPQPRQGTSPRNSCQPGVCLSLPCQRGPARRASRWTGAERLGRGLCRTLGSFREDL